MIHINERYCCFPGIEVTCPTEQELKDFFKTDILPFRLTDITHFVSLWVLKHLMNEVEDSDPRLINMGWCYNWAFLVWCLSPDKQGILFHTFDDGPGHVVIEYDGRFYDSEHPNGIKSSRCFSFYGQTCCVQSLCMMIRFWYGIHKLKSVSSILEALSDCEKRHRIYG